MRPLRVALGAVALFAVPAGLLAQPAQSQAPHPPNVRPNPPVTRPHPAPSGAFAHRPNRHHHHRRSNSYPVIIDGSFVERYLATPTPVPKRHFAPRSNGGEDVFETHSTDDAK